MKKDYILGVNFLSSRVVSRGQMPLQRGAAASAGDVWTRHPCQPRTSGPCGQHAHRSDPWVTGVPGTRCGPSYPKGHQVGTERLSVPALRECGERATGGHCSAVPVGHRAKDSGCCSPSAALQGAVWGLALPVLPPRCPGGAFPSRAWGWGTPGATNRKGRRIQPRRPRLTAKPHPA